MTEKLTDSDAQQFASHLVRVGWWRRKDAERFFEWRKETFAEAENRLQQMIEQENKQKREASCTPI